MEWNSFRWASLDFTSASDSSRLKQTWKVENSLDIFILNKDDSGKPSFAVSNRPSCGFYQGLKYPSVRCVYSRNSKDACRINMAENSVLYRPNPPQGSYITQQSQPQQPNICPQTQSYLEHQVSSQLYPETSRKTEILPAPMLSAISFPVCNHAEHLHDVGLQRRQQVGGPIERPWWMWCIGWMDIISAAVNLVLVVYLILFKSISGKVSWFNQTSLQVLMIFNFVLSLCARPWKLHLAVFYRIFGNRC